jgi:hypothetical protein
MVIIMILLLFSNQWHKKKSFSHDFTCMASLEA